MNTTEPNTLLLLLDWEKAFDKVDHEKLIEAIYRMNVPDKYIDIIKVSTKTRISGLEIERESRPIENRLLELDKGVHYHHTCLTSS